MSRIKRALKRLATAALLGVFAHGAVWADCTNPDGREAEIHSSDRRLKKNIQPLAQGLAAIGELKPVTYEWRYPQDDGMRGTQYGLIAQDVLPVLPDLVHNRGDFSKSTLSLDYNGFIPVLINAVQELKAANDNLAKRVDELEAHKAVHP